MSSCGYTLTGKTLKRIKVKDLDHFELKNDGIRHGATEGGGYDFYKEKNIFTV